MTGLDRVVASKKIRKIFLALDTSCIKYFLLNLPTFIYKMSKYGDLTKMNIGKGSMPRAETL